MLFCLTPTGNIEERDHRTAGPWESFKKGPNALVFERELENGLKVNYLRCYVEVN